MTFDIIGIGEALIEFAEYEPQRYVQSFAGDVLNTLYYASRLGLHTSFVSTIGEDSYSEDLIRFLAMAGIDRSSLRNTAKRNGLYIIRTGKNGEPRFTFFRNDSAARETFEIISNQELEKINDTRIIHLSAIGLAVFRNVDRLLSRLVGRAEDTLLFFDLNVRPALWADIGELRSMLGALASVVDILSVSMSDDLALFGARTQLEALDYYYALGYRKLIIRNGDADVLLRFDGNTCVVPAIFVQDVVDCTGAGDAFNAAFMYGILRSHPPDVAARLGCKAAAQVVRHRGGIVDEFDPLLVKP